MISLTGNPHPTLMDGLDPARLAKAVPVDLIQELMPLMTTNQVAWTVAGAPTKGWADSVGVSDVAALWDAVATSMRLDQADPVAAWQSHIAKLKARAAVLNAHGFDKIRYRGPGTDLTLGLTSRSRWVGGSVENEAGVEFVPNMPTEEVFVSPDWRRAEGTVRTSAPFFLASMGALVEGLALEVRDGTVTGATAERGEEAVQAQFDLIPRSRHFGEVAIVDADSAVAATGWSTRTCCSTRTSAPTSPGAWATRPPWTTPSASPRSSASTRASTRPTPTSTSSSGARRCRSTGSTPTGRRWPSPAATSSCSPTDTLGP